MMTDISGSDSGFPSKHHDPSASVPSLRHLPHSSSFVSLARSEGDASLFAPTFVQNPSVVDLPSQSDIIIAYVDPISISLLSKTQNTAVSWARQERVKVQSVSCALFLSMSIH
jgi:hypothetical protein